VEEINKFLTKAMGRCWHEPYMHRDGRYQERYATSTCANCHKTPYENNDFLTWEGFGKLWEWSVKQEWWIDFIKQSTYLDNSQEEIEADIFHLKLGLIDFIVPSKFSKAVFLYLQNKV
jgi:hypothetical protein